MDAGDYLAEVKAKIVASALVVTVDVVEEWTLPGRGYFRARFVMSNGDFLELAEYFVVVDESLQTMRYRYQWMDGERTVLRRRWDNVEHYPDLPGFPDHIHLGEGGGVVSGQRLNILQVLDSIETTIGEGT